MYKARRKMLLIILILGVFSFSPLLSYEADVEKKTEKQEKVMQIIKAGDELYSKRENLQNVMKAIDKYKEALEIDGKCYEAVWRISRAYYYYGWRLDEDDDEGKKEMFGRGIHWGKIAVKYGGDRPDGHFWLGVNYGCWGEANGVFKSISMVDDVEEEMHETIKIDPSYEGGGPYRLLGRMEYRLPGLLGGDNDDSIKYLRKAIELGPNNTQNYLFLAETLMEEDEYVEAKRLLEKVISMKPDPRWINEAKEDRAIAKELLIEVKEELED